ncbi:hypothetical protein INS49_009127 [Diaporthe citri]|uniref:uncharacterized protein n=1 Tax=Diaporthe citri TaxID=83186 RepID=UPI001C7F78B7|nr:uncharacterized protein INS49_009127 [Diaporthe citri]KAG6364024.1 hypothetical protein INS49_009127 [Diaporthe citri]
MPLLCRARKLERVLFFGSSGPYLALPVENLLEVNLINCHFVESELRNPLQHCRRLRKCVCAGGAKACEVIEALEPAHSSLEVLGMDLRRWAGPRGLRIPSLEQFVALKVLYIDLICVWDWRSGNNTDSPPSPDMLFTTLLPESIEEVALFGMGSNAAAYGFEVEAHVKRLASDRKEKGRFQQLKQLRGQGFWPFGYDVDPRSVANDDIVPRITALNDAKTVLGDNGVEVIFDAEGDSDLEFGNIISFC